MAAIALAVAVALALAIVAGCDEAGPSGGSGGPHPATLAGTSWSILSAAGRPAVPGSNPTIAFADSAARGSGGCNSFGGAYRYDPASGALAFAELGMTAMACAEPNRNDFETLFVQVLQRVDSSGIDPDGHLILAGPAGQIVLIRLVEG